MQVHLNEPILTSDGQNAGKIDKVILDADTTTVTSVVLRQGMLLPHDVEINLNQLTEDADGRHRLVFDANEFAKLPTFDPTQYSPPPPDLSLPTDFTHDQVLLPAGWLGTLGPGAAIPVGLESTVPADVAQKLHEQDLANAVIAAGSAIVSNDGHQIGELAGLTFTDPGRQLVSLVVRQGFLFPKEHELPGSLVAGAKDGVIYLNVDKDRVAKLIEAAPKAAARRF
jgi:sporulation protein YlmC with PRC-barrel domain